MLRSIFFAAPLLAFALPFAAPQPSEARPLASQPQQTQWCWGDDECGDGDDGSGDSCEEVTVCVYAELKLCDEDRQSQRAACSNTCTQLAANSCTTSLGSSASPDTLATCKTDLAARCESDCTRPKTLGIFDPTLGGNKPHPQGGMDHDDDDGDGGGDGGGDGDDHDGDDHDDDDHDDDDCHGGGSSDDCVILKASACIKVHD